MYGDGMTETDRPPASGNRPAPWSSVRADDPSALKALTHPLRVRMLAHLRLHGDATASQLGRVFGESSGATSYHLRQLERFGFVESTADQPSRRERRWHATTETTEFDLVADDPGARDAIDVLVRRQIETLVEGVTRRQREAADWPREWSEAHFSDDYAVRLTPDALHRVQAAVQSALKQERVADTDPDSRLVLVHLHSYFAQGERP
jgi:DNA-binding transcriptional ArsR family regulator